MPAKRSTTGKPPRVNPEWTDIMIARDRPARDVLPEIFGAQTAATMLKPRGRRKSPTSKIAISLRLSPDTLARWKATGPGWQTRMAEVLREAV
ncbi:MAG: BrnA antitoxin family protein [Candidatus Binatia bacterium]